MGWLFTVRMINYMFGDAERRTSHEQHNGIKTLGQQYYMTLDSNNLQNMRDINTEVQQASQHAVLTSNSKFDVDTFNVWDFFTKKFTQDGDGNYYLDDFSHATWKPFMKPWDWELKNPVDRRSKRT